MNDKSLGIYVLSEKKFYYLETGDNYVSNTVDRIKKALVARGIIKTPTVGSYANPGYEIMSCLQAKLKEVETHPIYISDNVRESISKNATNTNKGYTFK
jgi:hypothetical protein